MPKIIFGVPKKGAIQEEGAGVEFIGDVSFSDSTWTVPATAGPLELFKKTTVKLSTTSEHSISDKIDIPANTLIAGFTIVVTEEVSFDSAQKMGWNVGTSADGTGVTQVAHDDDSIVASATSVAVGITSSTFGHSGAIVADTTAATYQKVARDSVNWSATARSFYFRINAGNGSSVFPLTGVCTCIIHYIVIEL